MKTYTENDLRKLVELIDDSYRPYTRDNFQGSNVLEEFLRGDFEEDQELNDDDVFFYGLSEDDILNCIAFEWAQN